MSWPEFLGWLDSIGFYIGGYHLSLLGAFKVLTVIIGLTVVGWTLTRFVRRLFRRMTRLDLAQQVLGEKLVNIAVWTALVLFGVDVLGINLTALTVFPVRSALPSALACKRRWAILFRASSC